MSDISDVEHDNSDNDDRSANATTDIACAWARYGGSMKLTGEGVLRRFGRVAIVIVARVCDVS